MMDTHTGVASAVYGQYKEATGDNAKTVIASTASPYKFARSVMSAVFGAQPGMDEFAVIAEMSKTSGVPVPRAVEELRGAAVRHTTECDVNQMKQTVKTLLNI